MRVLIMGVDHIIQRPFWSSDSRAQQFADQQKGRFAEEVREAIRGRCIEFVGEEANHAEESIAEQVCQREGCRYANIEMPPTERMLRGIPAGYNENPNVAPGEKDRGNREREEYMTNRVLDEAAHCESLLIICGSRHSEHLAGRLRALGHTAEVDDLQKRSWWVADWMSHILENL